MARLERKYSQRLGDKKFHSPESARGQEMSAVNNARPFICNVDGCNQGFTRLETCRRHIINVHDKTPEEIGLDEVDPRPFTCNVDGCYQKFDRLERCRRHIRDVHDKAPDLKGRDEAELEGFEAQSVFVPIDDASVDAATHHPSPSPRKRRRLQESEDSYVVSDSGSGPREQVQALRAQLEDLKNRHANQLRQVKESYARELKDQRDLTQYFFKSYTRLLERIGLEAEDVDSAHLGG